MRIPQGLIIFTLLFCGFSAHAQEALSDASYLRKMSLHIRGIKPSLKDYETLKQLSGEAAKKQFLNQKLNEYLATKEHASRMRFRLSELFQLRSSRIIENNYSNPDLIAGSNNDDSSAPDSLTDLFERLAKENLSWDELLTGKSYSAYTSKVDADDGGDLTYFKFVAPELPDFVEPQTGNDGTILVPEMNLAPIPLKFEKNDVRVAGALTTFRFSSRYNSTALNKNRRRAAAVFRIFLCDSMVPAIASGVDRTHEFLEKSFAQRFEVTESDLEQIVQSADKRHGSDKNCIACHSKLDPLGRSLHGSLVSLHPRAFGGHLFYPRGTNDFVKIQGKGIGELAQAITEQKEYVDCQIQWFWNQFIGKDVSLTGTRKAELISQFNSVGRKTNDFIKVMIQAPEFKIKPQPTGLNFNDVKPLLRRCDSCHTNEGYIPNFSSLPIGYSGSAQEQSQWLTDMKRRLEIPNGQKGRMPKDRDQNWLESDIQKILTWLNTGAADENGNAMLPGIQK